MCPRSMPQLNECTERERGMKGRDKTAECMRERWWYESRLRKREKTRLTEQLRERERARAVRGRAQGETLLFIDIQGNVLMTKE